MRQSAGEEPKESGDADPDKEELSHCKTAVEKRSGAQQQGGDEHSEKCERNEEADNLMGDEKEAE